MTTSRSALIAVWFAMFAAVVYPEHPSEPAPARVLVIHSYGTDYQWTRDLDAGIRSVLQADPNDYATVFSEFLDAKYHSTADYFAAQATFLATKYTGWQFDAIVVTDNLALEFVRQYRDEVFGPVPTVFAGINDWEPALTAGLARVSGIPEAVSIEETLHLALNLTAGDRVIALGDGTLTFERNFAILERALAAMDPAPELIVFPTIRMAELDALADLVTSRDAVLLLSSIREDDNTVADFWRAGVLVSSTLPVPVFSMWDFFIGTGIAGGFLVSGQVQGAAAATLVEQILAGVSVDTIPVTGTSPNRWIFDMEPLSRAGITATSLPKDATLYNAETHIWDAYRVELLVMGVVLLTMALLISLLFVNIRNRALTAERLRHSLSEKEILLKEIHHRVKNNLQVISSILSLQSASIADQQSLGYFKDCETRVQSMALVHEQLYQTESFERIHLPSYIGELVSSLYSAMTIAAAHVTITQDIADLSLHLDQAIPVGLVINELVSNAIKYAYGDGSSGTIDIVVRRDEDRVTISVRDHGVGMDASAKRTTSLGLQLVEALARQLHGTISFEATPPGTHVVFTFPHVHAAVT